MLRHMSQICLICSIYFHKYHIEPATSHKGVQQYPSASLCFYISSLRFFSGVSMSFLTRKSVCIILLLKTLQCLLIFLGMKSKSVVQPARLHRYPVHFASISINLSIRKAPTTLGSGGLCNILST